MLDYPAYQKADAAARRAREAWESAYRRRMADDGAEPHRALSARVTRQDLAAWRDRIARESAAALAYIDARLAMHRAEYGEA